MAKYFIEDTTLVNIANAVRSKAGTTTKYKPTDLPAAIMAIGATTGASVIAGSFTPAESDNASGKSIAVSVPKVPRAVLVQKATPTTEFSGDGYAIEAVMTINGNPTPALGQSALTAARYQGSAGTSLTQGVSFSAYPYGDTATQNASAYGRTFCCTSNSVLFKTNGNYRYRTGVTYNYYIVLD